MTRQVFLKITSVIFLWLCVGFNSYSEIIEDSTFGYSIDIPEGYELAASSDDNMSLIFDHKNIPVTLALKIYQATSDSHTVLKSAMDKLNAKAELSELNWCEKKCAISLFTMKLDQNYSGWAVCAPTIYDDYFITLISYAPEEKADGCQEFIISPLNSLKIGSYKSCGIITDFAYPPESEKTVLLKIGKKGIQTKLNTVDKEAANFVINTEYNILLLYGKHKLWKEAWKRYYRMIYRDSDARLQRCIKDIYKALYPLAQEANPENPDLALAQMLLTWTQNFDYQRADNGNQSDFTSLPASLMGEGSDCDSRAMLMTVLLKNYGIDSLLLFSPEYSHAMVAANLNGLGQEYTNPETNVNYLMGETTAKVTWGTIAQDHADRSKWFSVDFE